jgi:phosphate transport system substrate-binding protein
MNIISVIRRVRYACAIGVVAASVLGASQMAVAANKAALVELHGAGSTFVQPILTEWASNWSTKSGIKINYEGGGSGAGITKVKAGQVDFGATDAPLAEEDLAKNNLVQFPIVAGAIVVVENVQGLGNRRRLQINGKTLADIFMGKITRWNDPALAALNAGASLPDAPITVVHRSEGSGTTYNFSAYLTKISPDWAAKYGTAKTIGWPVGAGTEGNQNVANMVGNTPNSIGYVEYGWALAHNMRIATLHDSTGGTVYPTQTTIRNALDAADWEHAASFNLMLVGVEGKEAWPIAATTWILMPSKGANTAKCLEFFKFALDGGGALADAQGYTPLSSKLVKLVESSWHTTFAGAAAGSGGGH